MTVVPTQLALRNLAERSVRDPATGCLRWTGYRNRDGYGRVRNGARDDQVHRVAYVAAGRDIPEGFEVDHICGTRDCIDPAHLRAVSPAGNKQHMTRLYRNNQSGYPGVSFRAARGNWRAQAKRGGRYVTLGSFSDPWDAYQAYVAHVREHYPYADERLLTLSRHT